MTVYVDYLVVYPERPFGSGRWSHMMADTEEELHRFALSIGLKRRWFQGPPRRRFPHYDLTASRHRLAIQRGAVLVTARDLVTMFPPCN